MKRKKNKIKSKKEEIMIRFLKLIFNRFKKLLKLNDINSMNNKVKVINKNYKKK